MKINFKFCLFALLCACLACWKFWPKHERCCVKIQVQFNQLLTTRASLAREFLIESATAYPGVPATSEAIAHNERAIVEAWDHLYGFDSGEKLSVLLNINTQLYEQLVTVVLAHGDPKSILEELGKNAFRSAKFFAKANDLIDFKTIKDMLREQIGFVLEQVTATAVPNYAVSVRAYLDTLDQAGIIAEYLASATCYRCHASKAH